MKAVLQAETARMQQLRKLTEVSRALTNAASLDEVFQLAVTRAADLLAAEQALLLVLDDDRLLVLRSSYGVDAALSERLHEPLTEGLASRLATLVGARPEHFLGVPLVVAGAIKGILVVIRRAPSTSAEQDEWLLSALADQAAVALEKRRLDEVAEFREQLIGIVGHDLRNPLSSITMGAQVLLLQEGLGARETELVRRIARSASVASRLIGQLLDLTRSRLGGGIPIEPRRLDLNELCAQVIGEAELSHPDRPVRLEVRGDVIGVWDRDRLYQVLANLVGNAVQHGEPQTPIDVRLDGTATEVVIEIGNRGEPIAPAMLPVIFDAFRKARSGQPTRETHGLGLGLFIVQQIIQAHGGSIAVTSSEADGTTFRVRLDRGRPG